jgi:hypothetical protein
MEFVNPSTKEILKMSTPMNKEQLLQAAKLITLAAEGKFTKQAKQQYYGFKGVDYISRFN